jgi:hypothetical protein
VVQFGARRSLHVRWWGAPTTAVLYKYLILMNKYSGIPFALRNGEGGSQQQASRLHPPPLVLFGRAEIAPAFFPRAPRLSVKNSPAAPMLGLTVSAATMLQIFLPRVVRHSASPAAGWFA